MPEINLKKQLHIQMEKECASPKKTKTEIQNVIARMAEWSKAVDLSPTISGCAGSTPASCIFFEACVRACACVCVCVCVCVFDAFVAQSVERAAVNRKVIGSNPVEGDYIFYYNTML